MGTSVSGRLSLVRASDSAGEVRVILMTELGAIEVCVDPVRAPISAADFLKYVNLGLLDGGAFYRTVRPDNDVNLVKINSIQGGVTDDSKFLPPVPHEPTSKTGIRHHNGTISLGRREPGTATGGSFFICVGEQPELDFGGRRNPDRLGFAAFGHVTRGMDVVHLVWGARTNRPDGHLGGQMIARPVQILTGRAGVVSELEDNAIIGRAAGASRSIEIPISALN
jgi:peptidyl-prolyl cis-trans isomerase A (cyclophilin A)